MSWTYDGIYRLTNELIANDPSKNNGTVSYGLDPVGNRTDELSSLPDISSGAWSYNIDDEQSNEQYDQDGNVIAEGGKAFSYNSQDQMVTMTETGTAASIIYDAFGNRVAKTVNGVTTKYLVEDDKNPTGYPQVFDELTNGAVTRTYTYGLQRISQEQVISNTWTSNFYSYDGGGNVRQLTNVAGSVTDSFEYDAYGNALVTTGSTPNEFLYRGEQFDADLSLYYLRARYYNPLTARFTGVDPLTDQGQKRYEYAAADPVNGADPTGTEDLAEYRPLFPGPLPFVAVAFPHFECGTLEETLGSIADLLPFCSEPSSPPPPSPHYKLGIGIEVPGSYAVSARGLNLVLDAGHTFVYLRDANDNITSQSELSFGPGASIRDNFNQFMNGDLPGNAHWPLKGAISTWESNISQNQYQLGVSNIAQFKADVPNYTPQFNCTTAALSIATKVGLNLPNGIGPAFGFLPFTGSWSGNVPNPWNLNQEMTSAYGPAQIRTASDFPTP